MPTLGIMRGTDIKYCSLLAKTVPIIQAELIEEFGETDIEILSDFKREYNPKLWYYTKLAYDEKGRRSLVNELVRCHSHRIQPIKCIVVDLDNTLWGGVISEDSASEIEYGGHNALGEVYEDIQRVLVEARSKGLMLAIASKNDERDVERIYEVFNGGRNAT